MKEHTENLEQYQDKMQSFRLFQYLTAAERDELFSAGHLISYSDNETIIREGENSHHIFTVINGAANIMVTREEDKQVFISAIGEGDIFGEAAIFLNTHRTASAIAQGDLTLFRLDRQPFLRFLRKNSTGGIKLLMLIIHSILAKLREANQELAFERKAAISQDGVDDLIQSLFNQ